MTTIPLYPPSADTPIPIHRDLDGSQSLPGRNGEVVNLSPYPEYTCEPCCQMGPRETDHVILKRRIVGGVFCGSLEGAYFSMCLEVRLIQAG